MSTLTALAFRAYYQRASDSICLFSPQGKAGIPTDKIFRQVNLAERPPTSCTLLPNWLYLQPQFFTCIRSFFGKLLRACEFHYLYTPRKTYSYSVAARLPCCEKMQKVWQFGNVVPLTNVVQPYYEQQLIKVN